MSDTKLSGLTELASGIALTDELTVVDKSDTTMAASGTNKKVLAQTLVEDPGFNQSIPMTGITYDNYNRQERVYAGTIAPTSKQLRLQAIWLPAGFSVASISWFIGTTSLTRGSTSPHFWVALYNSALGLLRQSTDNTSATITASTLLTTNLSSAYVTTYTGLHYLGFMCATGTSGSPVMPTLAGLTITTATISALPPNLGANADANLAATAPSTATLGSAATGVPYCGVA